MFHVSIPGGPNGNKNWESTGWILKWGIFSPSVGWAYNVGCLKGGVWIEVNPGEAVPIAPWGWALERSYPTTPGLSIAFLHPHLPFKAEASPTLPSPPPQETDAWGLQGGSWGKISNPYLLLNVSPWVLTSPFPTSSLVTRKMPATIYMQKGCNVW